MKEISITFSATVMVEDDVETKDIKILVQHENAALESKVTMESVKIIENLVEPYLPIVMNEWFECTSDTCQYRRECAQAAGAGDYRSEGGMTPRLRQEGENFFCQSQAMNPVDEDGYYDMPRGHENSGAWVRTKKGELILYQDHLEQLLDED